MTECDPSLFDGIISFQCVPIALLSQSRPHWAPFNRTQNRNYVIHRCQTEAHQKKKKEKKKKLKAKVKEKEKEKGKKKVE